MIAISDGRKIGRTDPALKGSYGIDQAKIVQNTQTEIKALAVPDERSVAERWPRSSSHASKPGHERTGSVRRCHHSKQSRQVQVISRVSEAWRCTGRAMPHFAHPTS